MSNVFAFRFVIVGVLCLAGNVFADIRVKQKVTMGGQSFETTRSIKGSRERIEQRMEMSEPGMADFMPQIATITQCDLKRTVRLNDRKQLYMVEPFQNVSDATRAPSGQRMTPAASQTTTTRRGGTMTMTQTVKDTGERKTMFGLQARHLIITQEMETSADSCSGPSRTKMEFDGWYVDFSADFNCPAPQPQTPMSSGANKPDCMDRIVTKGNAATSTGFLLEGTMKIYGADGSAPMTQTTQTLELSRAPLDFSLFDVPAGYRQTASSQELYARSMPSIGNMMGDNSRGVGSGVPGPGSVPPTDPGAKSIAVKITLAPGSAANQSEIEEYVRRQVEGRGLKAVTGSGDYTLTIQVRQVKESAAGKIGGMFGKVTGVETKAGKVEIDMAATISGASSGEVKVKSKFDAPAADALRAAIDQALNELLIDIDN
jgi:hypothetical protein